MTGLHGGHALIRGNREIRPEGQYPIPDQTVTLPERLKQVGYVTGAFGKWGLGPPASEGDPLNQGFDEFFGYNCQRHAHTYYPTYLWHNDEKISLDGQTYSADLIADKARDFISRHRDDRFFCFMPLTVPHAALHVPEESAAPFRDKFSQFEDKIGRYAGPEIKNPAACFAGMMTRLDTEIGRVLDLLVELEIHEETVVFLTSDNGAHHEGGHMPDFFNSTGPLRGLKRDLYEGGIRVPLIARWPGTIAPGTITDHASAFWDVVPTFCELAGAAPPETTDGISFVPTLLGKADEQESHEFLYWEFPPQGGKQAVRLGDWKGVRLRVQKNPDAPLELYNLKDDLSETDNLAGRHPDIVARIEQIMAREHTDSELFPLFQ
jgi:arylsulfatase A-like enzyme